MAGAEFVIIRRGTLSLMEAQVIQTSITLATIVGLWAMGLVTVLKNTRNKANRAFACLTGTLGLWLLFLLLADSLNDASRSLWALRVALGIGTLIAPSLLYFCRYFPVQLRPIARRYHILSVAPAVFFVALAPTAWLVPSVSLATGTAVPEDIGLLYTLQTLYVVAAFITSFIILVKKLGKVNPRQRSQIGLVLASLGVALFVNVFTGFILLVLDKSTEYSSFVGELSLLLVVAACSYAIIKHRLFDIRLAIVRAIGFVLTVGVVSVFYAVVVVFLGSLLINTQGSTGSLEGSRHALLFIIPTLFVGFTFHPLQEGIARLTSRIFYQDDYEPQKVLDELSDVLLAANDVKRIMVKSTELINATLRPAFSYFVIFDEMGRVLRSLGGKPPKLDMVALLSEVRAQAANPVISDNFRDGENPKSFTQSDIAIALRLGTGRRPGGLLLLGPKQSGRVYSRKDAELLRTCAKNLGIALENAKKNEQITHFADRLRDEVKRATARLRKANTELKTLDALKDDFISMTSHQLRSPATSVHEALHLVRETETTGAEREKLIRLAEGSSQRLVAVINDMLNIARIQAGQFALSERNISLQEVLARVLGQTGVLAEQKNISYTVRKPEEPLVLRGDSAKLSEALSNYLENAIKYSPDGSKVVIDLRQEEDKAIVEVKDTGIGVSKSEQPNLFGKFFRTKAAQREQPDGNGIGLFVVKAIIEAHGGGVYYKPHTKGSIFGFWIPLKKDTQPTS